MHTKYFVQNKRLDLYFPKRKLGIEIDVYGHVDRSFEDEQSIQLMTAVKIGCKIIRTNPDAPDFNIYVKIWTNESSTYAHWTID